METKKENVTTALIEWELGRNTPQQTQRDFDLVNAISAYNWSPEATGVESTVLARDVWPKVFEYHALRCADIRLEYVLLSGLFANGEWRLLFDRYATARELVFVAIRHLEIDTGADKVCVDVVALRIAVAIKEWLVPEVDPNEVRKRDIAAALFGEPWCAVVYDSRTQDDSLASLIMSTQPEFLPGRLTSSLGCGAIELPSMDWV